MLGPLYQYHNKTIDFNQGLACHDPLCTQFEHFKKRLDRVKLFTFKFGF